jgi:hypothetical protein
MIRIAQTNYGHGTNRCVMNGDKLIATIHQHDASLKLPGKWSVNWMTGRVDWHSSLAEARDNALKGL